MADFKETVLNGTSPAVRQYLFESPLGNGVALGVNRYGHNGI
jgi:hypothetical protein